MKWFGFVNKRLCEKNEARAYIKNVDEAMLEYYRVFAKWIKPLPSEPQLSDFYLPSERHKNGELLLVTVWAQHWQHMLFASLLNKWDNKLKEVYYQPDHLWTGVRQ